MGQFIVSDKDKSKHTRPLSEVKQSLGPPELVFSKQYSLRKTGRVQDSILLGLELD